jgi:hypothetical protein
MLTRGSTLKIKGIRMHDDDHPETYLITLPDGVILDPHPMKPAEMADKDENGEKGDPMYEGVVFGTTEMPIESKERLKRIFDDTKILEAWPVGTTTPSTEASIQITGEPPSSLPYRRNEGDREVIRTLVQDLIDKRRVQESTSPYASPVHLVKKGT